VWPLRQRGHGDLPERFNPRLLLLHDLGVLEHRDPAIARRLSFDRDHFARVIGQLAVHGFMIADDQICFAFADDSNRAAAFDAFPQALKNPFRRRAAHDKKRSVRPEAPKKFRNFGVPFF
jgi:hypothetical protein